MARTGRRLRTVDAGDMVLKPDLESAFRRPVRTGADSLVLLGYTATLMPGVFHVSYAYCYRCIYKLTYPECDMWCVRVIEDVYFENQIPPNDLAAICMEVVQGEGGYVVPPKEFVKMVFDLTRKYKCLLIDDEVQSGMGRTGKMWACEHFGVEPDIICSAKSLGGGLPIAATIVDEKLNFDRYGRHSNTFGGASLAHASALATLDVIEEEKLIDRAAKLGKQAKKRLEEMQATARPGST